MPCRYRLIRISYVPYKGKPVAAVTEVPICLDKYIIQKSISLFGKHLWWKLALPNTFTSEKEAFTALDHLCDDTYRETRQLWRRENLT